MTPAILLPTCDKYEPVWAGWQHYWAKHWRETWPLYILGETKTPPMPNAIPILAPRPTWTEMMRAAIAVIPEEWILLVLEDFWLTDTPAMPNLDMVPADVVAVRVAPNSKYYTLLDSGPLLMTGFKYYAKDSQYLVSCQPTFWRKEALKELVSVNEDPWQFEIQGTERFRQKPWNVVLRECDWYEHTVRQGKWLPVGVAMKEAMREEMTHVSLKSLPCGKMTHGGPHHAYAN